MSSRGHWGGKLGFILAAAGSAVGLGNIWKFPYVVGQNGGSAFILIYLACILFAGLPLLIAEIYIGKKSQLNPVGAFRFFQKGKIPYAIIGYMGVVTGIIILSYYSVISGWIFHYLTLSFRGFSGSDDEIRNIFVNLNNAPWLNIAWHTFVMGLVISIILKGVRRGVEAVSKVLMPLLGILMVLLVCYSLSLDGAAKALNFLLYPDFSHVSAHSVLEALGTSFFTLSLGMGAMITYGSYLKSSISIPKSAIQIAAIDTFIAFMAGLVIFPIVFSNNLEPSAGPSLIFQTLPVLFSKMAGGKIFSIAFFSLVIFAALTSAISLLEVVVSFAVDELKISRSKATIGFGFIVWLLGILPAVSSIKINDVSCLDFFDKITTCYLMPIGGLLTILVFGWSISKNEKMAEFGKNRTFRLIEFIVKYVSPILLLFIVADEIGIF